jgi:hypothetical protein
MYVYFLCFAFTLAYSGYRLKWPFFFWALRLSMFICLPLCFCFYILYLLFIDTILFIFSRPAFAYTCQHLHLCILLTLRFRSHLKWLWRLEVALALARSGSGLKWLWLEVAFSFFGGPSPQKIVYNSPTRVSVLGWGAEEKRRIITGLFIKRLASKIKETRQRALLCCVDDTRSIVGKPSMLRVVQWVPRVSTLVTKEGIMVKVSSSS